MSTFEAALKREQTGTVLAYLGLGSNLGDRSGHLRSAITCIESLRDTTLVEVSEFVETAPEFYEDQPDFLNACASITTRLNARELLDSLLEIETRLGRIRRVENGPRTIDLDILFYGDLVLDVEGLQIPHPGAHERRFVLEPLVTIAPEFRHPVLGRTVRELLEHLA